MDIHLLHTTLLCHIQHAENMLEVAVHAAGGHEPHHMQGPVIGNCVIQAFHIGGIFEEITVVNFLRHLRQNLEDDTACADVGVTDFGVAHLAFGKTHVKPGGDQLRVGIFGKQTVQIGLVCRGDGIARCSRGNAVTVQNNKNSFIRHRWPLKWITDLLL